MEIIKYNGAGNDFVMFDARKGASLPTDLFTPESIQSLCDRQNAWGGADGVIALREPETEGADFAMDYFNSDGSGGMMCGNGGRCIVAFAYDLGIVPGHASAGVCDANGNPAGGVCVFVFDAPDGCHHIGKVLETSPLNKKIEITIRHIDASLDDKDGNGIFVDSGTRHLVVFVPDSDAVDVAAEGARLRRLPQYGPIGVNVNFVQRLDNLHCNIRTFEKGVEAETLACGTGNVAAAVAMLLTDLNQRDDIGQAPGSCDDRQSVANVAPVRHILNAQGGVLEVQLYDIKAYTNKNGSLALSLEATLTGPTQRM